MESLWPSVHEILKKNKLALISISLTGILLRPPQNKNGVSKTFGWRDSEGKQISIISISINITMLLL